MSVEARSHTCDRRIPHSRAEDKRVQSNTHRAPLSQWALRSCSSWSRRTFVCMANSVKVKDTTAVPPTAHKTASASKNLQTGIEHEQREGPRGQRAQCTSTTTRAHLQPRAKKFRGTRRERFPQQDKTRMSTSVPALFHTEQSGA
ncbi:hypothetical protein EYF80_055631 [Liparis tanakae]|uniref:Uncharacterized protein n=1 Tax=Liparis tanakae TaxID=230148 RepID=A0A4Z2EZB3_9TELE|nr:hypothetical protein EYF80_055631 [Liparis tanakae]